MGFPPASEYNQTAQNTVTAQSLGVNEAVMARQNRSKRRPGKTGGRERAAKLIMVYYVPPKRCHGGIPPWTPKQKQSSLAPGFSWSPIIEESRQRVQLERQLIARLKTANIRFTDAQRVFEKS